MEHKYDRELTIDEAYNEWSLTDRELYFGQYIQKLISENVKILYTGDLYNFEDSQKD